LSPWDRRSRLGQTLASDSMVRPRVASRVLAQVPERDATKKGETQVEGSSAQQPEPGSTARKAFRPVNASTGPRHNVTDGGSSDCLLNGWRGGRTRQAASFYMADRGAAGRLSRPETCHKRRESECAASDGVGVVIVVVVAVVVVVGLVPTPRRRRQWV
jgi:hypothetical protein